MPAAPPIKFSVQMTDEVVTVAGTPCRVLTGTDSQGVPVRLLVKAIQVPATGVPLEAQLRYGKLMQPGLVRKLEG